MALGKSVMMFVKKEKIFLYVKDVTGSILVEKLLQLLFTVSCVKFLVNLFGVAGMKERIFIECNREHLRSNYSNSYNDFNFYSDSDDTDFSDMIKKTKN